MDDTLLLVRSYNVGLGDCIYVRVPDAGRPKHLLIDCGNKYGTADALGAAIADLRANLPVEDGTPTLDLLVATHAHEDHVKGFDPELFQGLRIRRIWLSAAMNPDHPQAEGTQALVGFAEQELRRLTDSEHRGLAAWAVDLLALSKADGMDSLRQDLPAANGIAPLYVHADTPAAELALFEDPGVTLRILGPMQDVDGYYLGEVLEDLRALQALRDEAGTPAGGGRSADPRPENVSPEDFDLLRRSLGGGALAFVLKSGELVNNTSVVLLLEWRGRRLLFVGDAEVKTAYGGEFREGKSNGSWNVMWAKQREALSRPVDFLKVGHHGSHNATPWTTKLLKGKPHPVNRLLDALLPPVAAGEEVPERYAVVSTERTGGYPTIPSPELMEELGRRVRNVHPYEEEPREGHGVPPGRQQPQRTDLEARAWVDVTFQPQDAAAPAPGGSP